MSSQNKLEWAKLPLYHSSSLPARTLPKPLPRCAGFLSLYLPGSQSGHSQSSRNSYTRLGNSLGSSLILNFSFCFHLSLTLGAHLAPPTPVSSPGSTAGPTHSSLLSHCDSQFPFAFSLYTHQHDCSLSRAQKQSHAVREAVTIWPWPRHGSWCWWLQG